MKNNSDCEWSNPQIVGDPSYPTYKNRPVIVSGSALTNLTSFMNSKAFPFKYDHAIGLLK